MPGLVFDTLAFGLSVVQNAKAYESLLVDCFSKGIGSAFQNVFES